MLDHLDKDCGKSLYEQIYEDIRGDILSGRLSLGEKLPSKRMTAERLRVSIITVENAYSQLIAEGYVKAAERSGYYVQYSGGAVDVPARREVQEEPPEQEVSVPDTEEPSAFPFTVWARLMRSVLLEKGTALLRPVRHGGAEELCRAISDYLYRARGFFVPHERIIIGAGTEYLYNLMIQLLGREQVYGIENPGYEKLPKIYALNGVKCEHIPLDSDGIIPEELERKGVTVAHISPAHHYPTGIVMPITRRRELMDWLAGGEERYVIEDDYDSEFRWSGKPVPTMFGMDASGRVIYINTFSQTIAPSVRISYMCLSEELYRLWTERLGFYSCPVPVFEQHTLARFISEGYFERHINRTKKRFRRIRELVLRMMEMFGGVTVSEENAGLHFTAEVAGDAEEFIAACIKCGLRITEMSDYYTPRGSFGKGQYVVNYAGAREDELTAFISGSSQAGLIK